MTRYLSKSDFKLAQTCPTKLFYKKQDYPTDLNEDEYLMLLADGGYMVEKIAKLLYPEGQEIGFDNSYEIAARDTLQALKADSATLFEATFISKGKLARVDILKKQGNEFRLIEVKAKSYNSQEDAQAKDSGYANLFRSKRGNGIVSGWQECVGNAGTVFMWTTHENTILATILRQMTDRKYTNPKLAKWIKTMVSSGNNSGRLVDLNQLAVRHYFHPIMKGRTSIKKVSDALWQTNPSLRNAFPEYVKEHDGKLLSPYDSLPPLQTSDQSVAVAEGTGAIRAYEAMVYGVEKDDPQTKNRWKRLRLLPRGPAHGRQSGKRRRHDRRDLWPTRRRPLRPARHPQTLANEGRQSRPDPPACRTANAVSQPTIGTR
jgi:hypothetical protein